MKTKIFWVVLTMLAVPHFVYGQHYYTEGTRWTELRLDTTKYDSWFTETYKDGVLTWVPNYESTEYYAKGDTVDVNGNPKHYVKFWRRTDGQPDSLQYLLADSVKDGKWSLYVRVYCNRSGFFRPLRPIETYMSNWELNNVIKTFGVQQAIITSGPTNTVGVINEIKQGTFGTDVPLTYMEINNGWQGGNHILIHGIGVTSWESRDCIFGPCMAWYAEYHDNHLMLNIDCRSILVHFEQDGKVLYDLWPTPDGGMASHVQGVKAAGKDADATYDLQGRRIEGKPSRGIYIIGGKKRVVK